MTNKKISCSCNWTENSCNQIIHNICVTGSNQRGSVMVVVLVVGLLIFLLGSALLGHYAVSENNAIEKNLTEIRYYWATMGHLGKLLNILKDNSSAENNDKETLIINNNNVTWDYSYKYKFQTITSKADDDPNAKYFLKDNAKGLALIKIIINKDLLNKDLLNKDLLNKDLFLRVQLCVGNSPLNTRNIATGCEDNATNSSGHGIISIETIDFLK